MSAESVLLKVCNKCRVQQAADFCAGVQMQTDKCRIATCSCNTNAAEVSQWTWTHVVLDVLAMKGSSVTQSPSKGPRHSNNSSVLLLPAHAKWASKFCSITGVEMCKHFPCPSKWESRFIWIRKCRPRKGSSHPQGVHMT